MKILHIIPNLEIGGAQTLLASLLPLLNQNHNVEIIVFKNKETEVSKAIIKYGIPVHFLNVSKFSYKTIFKLRKYIKNADIIHTHLFPAHYFTVIANFGINKPMVFTEHSTHNKRRNHKLLRPIEQFIYKRISSVVCISNETETNLNKWLKNKEVKASSLVIENGIDLDKFKVDQSINSEELFGKKGIPLLMISRFSLSKDHATVVRSLQYIDNPSVFVVFVGDGETIDTVKQLAHELGLNERVVFLGTRMDIPKIIHASKIGIQSSNWEGFGLTAIEMMAGGIPVISSDVNGLRQVVEDGGLIFPQGNHMELAKMINNLLNDQYLYNKLIEKGLHHSKKYSIQNTAGKYLELYNSLLVDY